MSKVLVLSHAQGLPLLNYFTLPLFDQTILKKNNFCCSFLLFYKGDCFPFNKGNELNLKKIKSQTATSKIACGAVDNFVKRGSK